MKITIILILLILVSVVAFVYNKILEFRIEKTRLSYMLYIKIDNLVTDYYLNVNDKINYFHLQNKMDSLKKMIEYSCSIDFDKISYQRISVYKFITDDKSEKLVDDILAERKLLKDSGYKDYYDEIISINTMLTYYSHPFKETMYDVKDKIQLRFIKCFFQLNKLYRLLKRKKKTYPKGGGVSVAYEVKEICSI